MVLNAGLLLQFGYPLSIIDLLPASVEVNLPGGVSGTFFLRSSEFLSATDAHRILLPAVSAGLKGNYKAQESIFEVLPPDFVMGRLTENELELSPDELEAWIRGGKTGTFPGEPVVEKAFLSIDSEPAGAKVFIDNVDTGQLTWIVSIAVSPGVHNIKVSGIEGFVETQGTATAIAGKTVKITIPMAPVPIGEPPTVPPVEPPTEPLPFSPFAQLLKHFLGAVPDWWKPIDDFTRWATENFGMDMTTNLSAENKALYEKLGLSDKILFFGGPMSIKQVGATAVGKQLATMTAEDFIENAARNPKATTTLLQSLAKGEFANYARGIGDNMLKRDVLQTGVRLILDANEKSLPLAAKLIKAAPNPTHLALMTAGVLGLASWASTDNLLWVLVGGVRDLINAGKPEEALTAIANARSTITFLNSNPVWRFVADFWLGFQREPIIAGTFNFLDIQESIARDNLAKEKTGSIAVETTPTNASIWINDRLNQWRSNTIIEKLIPGKYQIRVELAGHITHEKEVFVREEEQTPFVHEFEIIPPDIEPRGGRYQWEAKDKKTGATIGVAWFHNGNLQKSFTTADALDVIPDTYELRFTALGYKDWEDTILVELGKTTMVLVDMEKLDIPPPPPPDDDDTVTPDDGVEPEKGRLEVSSNTQAQIFIGGQDSGFKTPHSFDLTQGIYSIKLEANGFISRSTTTLVKSGEISNVALELREKDAPPTTTRLAKVSIQSEPSSAKILVNGVWTKKYTPDSILLEAGDYEIALSKSGFETWRTPLRLVEES